jgi:hypothetical protein
MAAAPRFVQFRAARSAHELKGSPVETKPLARGPAGPA